MEHFQEIMERQFRMTDRGRIDKIGDLYTTYNPDVNLEEYKQKGVLDAVASMMEPITMSLDDQDPGVIAYWAKRGMVKEFHGEDEPMSWSEYEARTGFHWEDPNREGLQNRFRQWTSYVPVSAFRKENRDRRYPTVIVLHGGFNPRSIVDGWGFPQEAARREWIVLAPALELSDLVGDMLSEAEKLYPIDPEKVYLHGYSGGGETGSLVMAKRPELYTAFLCCATQWDGNMTSLAEARTPVYMVTGENDSYYGSKPLKDAYEKLYDLYLTEGLTEREIDSLLILDIKEEQYFTARGFTDQHMGGQAFAKDESIMGWLFGAH